RHDGLQERLAQASATSASRGGTRTFLQLRQRIHPLLVNCLDDRALGHTHAAADGFTICHLCDVDTGIFGRSRKQKLPAQRSQILLCSQPVHVAVAVCCVSDENDASKSSIFQRQLSINSERRIFVADHFRTVEFV